MNAILSLQTLTASSADAERFETPLASDMSVYCGGMVPSGQSYHCTDGGPKTQMFGIA